MPTLPTPWTEHVKRVAAGEPTTEFPLVEIIWEDASAFAVNWTDEIDKESRTSLAVGYLMHQDDNVVTVVALMNPDQIGHGITIPTSMIISWRDLT